MMLKRHRVSKNERADEKKKREIRFVCFTECPLMCRNEITSIRDKICVCLCVCGKRKMALRADFPRFVSLIVHICLHLIGGTNIFIPTREVPRFLLFSASILQYSFSHTVLSSFVCPEWREKPFLWYTQQRYIDMSELTHTHTHFG